MADRVQLQGAGMLVERVEDAGIGHAEPVEGDEDVHESGTSSEQAGLDRERSAGCGGYLGDDAPMPVRVGGVRDELRGDQADAAGTGAVAVG